MVTSVRQHESIYHLAKELNAASGQPCPVCGETGLIQQTILWPELVQAWQLSEDEQQLIDRQQGEQCQACRSNLRSRTLAGAFCECLNWSGSLQALLKQSENPGLKLLELNEAGDCHHYFRQWSDYTFAAYPDVDMQALPYSDEQFDFVVHSDTLEHIPDPVIALKECKRVLSPNGCLIMTIPIVPTKLTRRRHGMEASYHGQLTTEENDMKVMTEYGADFYLDLFLAGWKKISLYTLGSAASIAVIGIK